MRHIEVKDLWLQEALCRGRLQIVKVDGKANPADIFTKFLNVKELVAGCERMCVELRLREGQKQAA